MESAISTWQPWLVTPPSTTSLASPRIGSSPSNDGCGRSSRRWHHLRSRWIMTWFVLLSKHYDWCDWLPIPGSCLFLDRKPSTTSKWGRFPADAKCHHKVFPANQTCDNGTQLLIQAGWRLSPPFCQYLHIQAVHPPLLQVRPQQKLSLWDCFWLILITQPFSKQILKAKLLMAIKTKNFGFVWLSVHEELSSSEAFPSWIVIVDGLFIGSVIVSLCPPKGKRSCGKTPEISVTSLCQ